MSWRPKEGWITSKILQSKIGIELPRGLTVRELLACEAGADAMLEALKKESLAIRVLLGTREICIPCEGKEAFWFIIIPDEDKK